jgi:hypothetical protein
MLQSFYINPIQNKTAPKGRLSMIYLECEGDVFTNGSKKISIVAIFG